MAISPFARAAAAAHRATIRLLGNAGDAKGRPLLMYWPATVLSDRRTVQVTFHQPPIAAYSGQGKRANAQGRGLTEIPEDTITFAARADLFPAAVPPATGVCFLAGPNQAEAVFYRTLRVSSYAGLVEIEATKET